MDEIIMDADLTRFYSHVHVDQLTGCHVWTRAKNDKGYGQFSVRRTRSERARVSRRSGNKRVQAHKWIFERVHGRVQHGMEVDHKCCNPACVNLDHLQPLTKAQNLALRGQVHM